MWHYRRSRIGFGVLRHAAACACSIAARASRRRSKSFSTKLGLSGAAAAASPGAPLYAAHPGDDARSHSDDPAARHAEGSTRVCAEARRLDRGAARPVAGSGAVCAMASSCRCAACRTASRIAAPRAARSGPRSTPTASGCCALPARLRISTGASAISCAAKPSATWKPPACAMPRDLGLAVRRVTVRDQSSRWGSCSTTGMLSFSWRLILAPSHVLDYLAAHEVAHLVEMNHSAKFWRAGAAHLPGS